MDNFASFFDFDKTDLLGARSEAEKLSKDGCDTDQNARDGARCDTIVWLPSHNTAVGDTNPSLKKIQRTMEEFSMELNIVSQTGNGDRNLQVDKEELQINRYNGASNKLQRYYRHKDNYFRDENNKLHGMSLRKLTMVIFLNDNIDEVKAQEDSRLGELRLYPDWENCEKVIDIVPRLGRAVLFRSEDMLHMVRPTLGYDNYAVTIYFT